MGTSLLIIETVEVDDSENPSSTFSIYIYMSAQNKYKQKKIER